MPQRKHKSNHLPWIGFPITKLPIELQHIVFAALTNEDIRSLRLTCKALAEIGLSYVMREAELLFTPSSFDRLATISLAHGSQFKSLFYRYDVLGEHHDFEEYVAVMGDQLWSKWSRPQPPTDPSDREWRRYERQMAKLTVPNCRYTKKQLRSGWEAYQDLWSEQKRLRDASYGDEEMTKAMLRLPNLKNVILAARASDSHKSEYFQHTYEKTLMDADGDEGYQEPCGVPQLLTLAQALQRAGTAVETFGAACISWKILAVDGEDRELLKRFASNLKSFISCFILGQAYEWHPPGQFGGFRQEDDACREFLNGGGHLELLRSMSNLRTLAVSFMPFSHEGINIEPLLRNIHWCHLRKVLLNKLKGTDRQLLDFLKRHAATLKILSLSDFWLDKGLWLYVFAEMRASLNLTTFELERYVENWYVHRDTWGPASSMPGSVVMTQKIQDFVQRSDQVTLGDIINHSSACSCQGGPYRDMHLSVAL